MIQSTIANTLPPAPVAVILKHFRHLYTCLWKSIVAQFGLITALTFAHVVASLVYS